MVQLLMKTSHYLQRKKKEYVVPLQKLQNISIIFGKAINGVHIQQCHFKASSDEAELRRGMIVEEVITAVQQVYTPF